MAARAALAPTIERLRRLIGDTAGADQAWTDEELQDALDARAEDVRYLALTPAATVQPGGATVTLDYYSPGWQDWETAALYNGSYGAVTAATADLLTGHWTFAADRSGPLFLVGRCFDIYAAAADVLEAWSDRARTTVTDWQQVVPAMLASAERYRRRARASFSRIVRSD